MRHGGSRNNTIISSSDSNSRSKRAGNLDQSSAGRLAIALGRVCAKRGASDRSIAVGIEINTFMATDH